jgi:hypothetical protein
MVDKYKILSCPECGALLEVYYEGTIEEYPGEPWDFKYGECRDLIRHCSKCGCDWENKWIAAFDSFCETELERKFWG